MCLFKSSSISDAELLARFLDLQKDLFNMDKKVKELENQVDFLESSVRHFMYVLSLATEEEVEKQSSFLYTNLKRLVKETKEKMELDKK